MNFDPLKDQLYLAAKMSLQPSYKNIFKIMWEIVIKKGNKQMIELEEIQVPHSSDDLIRMPTVNCWKTNNPVEN